MSARRRWPLSTDTTLFHTAGARLLGLIFIFANYQIQAEETAQVPFNLEIPHSHAASVRQIRYSSDGGYAVTLDRDGTAIQWDLQNGRPLGPLPFSASQIDIAATVPLLAALREQDGQHQIVVYDLEGHVSLDRIGSRTVQHDGQFDLYISHIAMFPDGKRILVRTASSFLGILDRESRTVQSLVSDKDLNAQIGSMAVLEGYIAALLNTPDKMLQLAIWRHDGKLLARHNLPCPPNESCHGIELTAIPSAGHLFFRMSVEGHSGSVFGVFDVARERLLWSERGNKVGAVPAGLGIRLLSQSQKSALDSETGAQDAEFLNLNSTVLSQLTIAESQGWPTNNRGLFISEHGITLVEVNARGNLSSRIVAPWVYAVYGMAAVGQNHQVVIVRGGELLRLDLLSGRIESVPIENPEPPRLLAFSADGGTVYRVYTESKGGMLNIIAVDSNSGAIVWNTNLSLSGTAKFGASKIFVEPSGHRVAIVWRAHNDGTHTSIAVFDAQDGSHLWTIPILPLDFGRFRGIVGFFVDASLCLLSESGDALKLSLSDGIAQRAAGVSDMSLLGWSFPVAFDGRVLTTSGVGSRESIRAIDWVRRSVNDLGIGVDSIELAAPSGIDHVLFGSENGAVSELDVVRGLFSGSFSPHGGRVAGMASIISSDRVVSVSRDGIVHISERSTGQLLVRIYLGFDGNPLLVTPEAYFSGDAQTMETIGVAFQDGRRLLPGSVQTRDLQRPDLVRRKLQGGSPAILIEERRSLDVKWQQRAADPPIASLLEPGDRTIVKGTHVQVSVMIRPGSDGIGDVIISRNGQPIITDHIGQGTTQIKYMLYDVPLVPGENRIYATATDRGGFVSEPSGVVIRSDGASPAKATVRLITISSGGNLASSPSIKILESTLRSFTPYLVGELERYDLSASNADSQLKSLSSRINPEDFALFVFEGAIEDFRRLGLVRNLSDLTAGSTDRTLVGDAIRIAGRVPAQKSLLLIDVTQRSGTALLTARTVDDMATLDRFLRSTGRMIVMRVGMTTTGELAKAFAETLRDSEYDADGVLTVAAWMRLAEERLNDGSTEHKSVVDSFVVGEDFPVVRNHERAASRMLDKRPTHVILSPVCGQSNGGDCRERLNPGFRVRVVNVEGDFAWIAHEGKSLGKIPVSFLAPLH